MIGLIARWLMGLECGHLPRELQWPSLFAGMPAAAPSQQATRHARRIYVGGLPPSSNEQNIATFFSNALAAVGGTTAGPGGLPPDFFTGSLSS